MVRMIDPRRACIATARAADQAPARVVYLSPQGRPLTQARVRELAAEPRMILLCGRYEGVDERLLAAEVDEEVSLGDYVLSRSEEHTSELQSLMRISYADFCLKKKNKDT